MPLKWEEQKWIANRKAIFNILLRIRRDEISIITAEKQIRDILYK